MKARNFNSTQSRGLQNQQFHPAEIFVGNLSYFCQESDLFNLFNTYAHVDNVRIITADNGTRPLMFGFVRLQTPAEALQMLRLLDGHLFQGRRIKIEYHDVPLHMQRSREELSRSALGPNHGVQVHIDIKSTFPTEQTGYGFITFSQESSAVEVIRLKSIIIPPGIALTCEGSRRSRYYRRREQTTDRPPPAGHLNGQSSLHLPPSRNSFFEDLESFQ